MPERAARARLVGGGPLTPLDRQSWFGLKAFVKRFLSLRVPHAILRGVLRIAPGLRSGRLPAPASLREVLGHADGATFVMLRPDRCEIAKELYWGDGRRPKAEDAFALELVTRLAREVDVFLDVGAYTGVFTLATTAANPQLRGHAFEIVPGVAELLEQNLRRNGVADRVEIHVEGIGVPGTSMLVPTGAGGSALPSFYSSRMHFEHGSRIGFRSLDSVAGLIPEGARVVMKIDVEGTEDAVFRHGQAFLEAFRPDILCEVLPIADGPVLQAMLEPHALGMYLVTERGIVPRQQLVPDQRFRDWLLTSREPDQLRAFGIAVAT